jgi:thiol-disulfide isomerase/thioredoxin
VIVDFYTFDCINCKHVQPNLRELYKSKSRNDLVIVSVHSPETPFERDRHNLVASAKVQGVQWPVAIDNDFKLWNEFGVSAWPTQLIFDRHGVLQQTIVGEGQDQLVNDTVDSLIKGK